MSVVMLQFVCSAVTAPPFAAEFQQDFRGQTPNYGMLELVSSAEPRLFESAAAGLRLKVLPEQGTFYYIGIAARFRVQGDFEITASYAIGQIQKPQQGFGAGLNIHLVATPEPDGTTYEANLHRVLTVDNKHTYLAHRMKQPRGEPPQHQTTASPTRATSGKLRLVRTANVLRYLVAEKNSTSFRELDQVQFGTGNLTWLNFAAHNGGANSAVEILWQDLTVRADAILGDTTVTPPSSSAWVWWLLLTLLTVTTVGALWWRKSKRTW